MTKLNARDALIAFVIDQGWELDPKQTVNARINIYSPERIQDPNAFRKADGTGGFWAIELDYNVKGKYNVTDTRLRSVTLRRQDGEGKVVEIGTNRREWIIELDPRHESGYTRSINYQAWHLTGGISGTPSLRQRAEVLIAAPALVVWLAAEKVAERIADLAEQDRKRREEAKARKRPLAITVDKDEWRDLTWNLERAASRLRNADGLTDIPAQLAAAQAALDVLKTVVKTPATALEVIV